MIKIIAGIFMLIFLSGCSPTQVTAIWTKYNYGKKFNRIMVLAVSKNLKIRQAFENEITKLLNEEGIQAVSALKFIPPNTRPRESDQDRIGLNLLRNGIDGVLTINPVQIENKKTYVPGQSYVVPSGHYRFGPYFYSSFRRVYQPGYVVTTSNFILESILYELPIKRQKDGKELVWVAQSKVYDPGTVESAAKSYSKALVKSIMESGVIL